MNRLILSQGSTFSVGAYSADTTVIGTRGGTEVVSIGVGAKVVFDGSFNAGGDSIKLAGNAASYTAVRVGSRVILTDLFGSSISIPVGPVGANIEFADSGPRKLVLDTISGIYKLGSDVIGDKVGVLTAGEGGTQAQFTLTKSVDSVGEDGSVLFTLSTIGVAAGTEYTYTLSGVSAHDVVGGALTGVAKIGADGKAVIQVNLAEDGRTEGTETLTLNVAGVSGAVEINDTSKAPSVIPTYVLKASSPNVDEGGTAVFTLETTDVAPGSQFNYLITGLNSADVVGGQLTGVATIGADGKALIAVNLAADAKTEGAETLRVTAAGVSDETVVNDTSLTPAITEVSYALTGSTNVSEGGIATFNLKTSGVAPGALVGYRIVGTGSAASVSSTGTFTVDADGNAVVSVPVGNNTTIGDSGALTVELLNGKSAPVIATVADTTPTTYAADAITAANAASGVLTINVAGNAAQTITLDTDQLTPTKGFVINSTSAPVNVTSAGGADKITITGNGNNTVNTGNENDIVLISGSGNNTVVTGSGNDAVTITGTGSNRVEVGAGNDTVTSGAGNDTIVVASGALDAADAIDGGDGDDTLVISGDNNVIDGVNVKNVENLVLNGTKVTINAAALADLESVRGSSTTSEISIAVSNGNIVDLTGISLTTLKSVTLTGSGTVTVKATAEDLQAVNAFLAGAGVTANLETDVAGFKALTNADTGFNGSKTVSDTAQNLIDNKAALTGASLSVSGTATLADVTALAAAGITSVAKTVSMSVAELINAAKYPDQLAALTAANTKIQVTGTATVSEAASLVNSYGTQISAYQSSATGNKGIAIVDTPANVAASLTVASNALTATGANAAQVSSISLTNGTGVLVSDAAKLALLASTKVSGSYTVTDSASAVNGAISGSTIDASLTKAASVSLTTAGRSVSSTADALELKALGAKLTSGYDLALDKGGATASPSGYSMGGAIQFTSITGMQVGATVTGFNIRENTTILSLDPTNKIITLSQPLLGSPLGYPVTVSPAPLSTDDLTAISAATKADLVKATPFSVSELLTILGQNANATVNKVSDTATNLAINSSKLSAVANDILVTTAATVAEAAAIKTALTALLAKSGTHASAGSSGSTYTNSYAIADEKKNILDANNSAIVKAADKVTVSDALTLNEANSLIGLTVSGTAGRTLNTTEIVYNVSDSAAALASALSASSNTGTVAALAGAGTVTATGTANVAQAAILGAQYSSANQVDAYKISDTVKNIFGSSTNSTVVTELSSGTALAKATSIAVEGAVTVQQLATLKGIQVNSAAIFDNKYAISDTAANVAAAAGSVLADLKAASTITVGTAAVADLAGLKTLNDALAVDGKALVSFALSDTISAISGSSAFGSSSAPVVAFAKTATSIKATGDASTITLAALDTLAIKAGTTSYSVELTDTSNAVAGLAAGVLTNAKVTKLALTGTSIAATINGGSTTVTVTSTDGLEVGAIVSGTGIPANATIASITGGTTFELSTAATGSGTSTPTLLTSLTVANASATISAIGSASSKLTYDLVDTYAHLTASASSSVVLNGVNLTATDALTAAKANTLIGLTGSAGTVSYKLVDTYAGLVAQNASVADGASSINVSNTSLKVAEYTELLRIAGLSNTVATTVAAEAISDTAEAVSGASAAVLSHTSGVTLTDNASLTLSVAQAKALTNSGATGYDVTTTPANAALQVKIADTAANLVAAKTNSGSDAAYTFILDAGSGTSGSYKVVTTDTATLNAADATTLLSISDISATFNLADRSYNLVSGSSPNFTAVGAVSKAGTVTVTATSSDPTSVFEAAAILAGNKATTFDVVTDTASNLGAYTGSGTSIVYTYASVLAKAGSVVVSSADTVANIGLVKAAAGSVSVKYDLSDTATLLSKASSADLSGATAISISGSTAAKASEAALLAPFASKFAASVAVTDTASALVANLAAVKAIATGANAVQLSGNATVDQYSTIKTQLGTKFAGGTISDTAAAVADYLAAGGSATGYSFTGKSTTVSAAQAASILANSAATTAVAGGLKIEGSAADLIALNNTNQSSYKVTSGAVELSVAKDLYGVFTTNLSKVDFSIATTAERFVNAYTYNSGDTAQLAALKAAGTVTVDGTAITLGSKNASLAAQSGYTGKIVGTVAELNALPASIKTAAGFVIVDSVANITSTANTALVAASAGYVVKDLASNVIAASSSVLNTTQKALGIELTDNDVSVQTIDRVLANTNTDAYVIYKLADNATNLAGATSAVANAKAVTVLGSADATQAQTILNANSKSVVNVVDTANNLVNTSVISATNLGKLASIVADANTATSTLDPITLTHANTLVRGKGATATLSFNVDGLAADIATAVNNVSGTGAELATLQAAGVITVTGGAAGTPASATEAKALAKVTITGGYAVSDAPTALVDSATVSLDDLAKATVVKASSAATVQEAITLAGLSKFERGTSTESSKYVLSISDSALNIAKAGAAAATLLDGRTSASTLTISYTDALTAAQATALKDLAASSTKLGAALIWADGSTTTAGVLVKDTAQALLDNAAAVTKVEKVEITDAVSVSKLNQIKGIDALDTVTNVAGYTYELADTVGNLVPAGSSVVGNATSVTVTGTISVGDIAIIESLAGAGTVATTTTYSVVSDTAANLFSGNSYVTAVDNVTSAAAWNGVIDLVGSANIAQVKTLLADSNFNKQYVVADTASAIISAINQDSDLALLNGADSVGLSSTSKATAAEASVINANLSNEAALALSDTAAQLNLAVYASTVAKAASVQVNMDTANDGLIAAITSAKITYTVDSLGDTVASGAGLDVINGKAGDVINLAGISDWDATSGTQTLLTAATSASAADLTVGKYFVERGYYSNGEFIVSNSGTDSRLLIETGGANSTGADEAIIILGVTSLTPDATGTNGVNYFTFG